MRGFVSLIGAGPGDPGLLTVKAAGRLGEADLVLHDALVSAEILALAPRARRFDVGKRAGRKSTPQETIHRTLIRAARRGERVVRLKGGDPFVLGRGGEEALALAAAGVPFEIVPGVTSAVAAPALSGIPVTHRGMSSAFLVVSGHGPEAYGPILDAIEPQSLTVVILMGLAHRAEIAASLIDRGWDPATPSATVCKGSMPAGDSRIATLKQWRDAGPTVPDGPGTLVVGQVVSLAERIGATDPIFFALEKGVAV